MADKLWDGYDTGNEGDLNVAANYIPSGVPAAGDNLTFPAGANNVTDSLTALNTATLSGALGVVIFEEGYEGTVASSDARMQFTCSRFEFASRGVAWIDLQASAIAPRVLETAQAGVGEFGLNLIGSALTTLDVMGGSVGICTRITEATTVATIRVVGTNAVVEVGENTSLTTFYQTGGTSVIRCAGTTLTAYGGSVTTREVGAWTTVNNRGGTIYPESTGTITTLNADGGTTNFLRSGAARTVTTLKQNPRATVSYDPAVTTITNRSAPDFPVILSATAP